MDAMAISTVMIDADELAMLLAEKTLVSPRYWMHTALCGDHRQNLSRSQPLNRLASPLRRLRCFVSYSTAAQMFIRFAGTARPVANPATPLAPTTGAQESAENLASSTKIAPIAFCYLRSAISDGCRHL
jgi:hypothetical protein